MRKALIVDDHEANLYLLQSVLAANGYQVASAPDGRAALQCAKADPPDIIISDILMPVMDGFTFCRLCRQEERLKAIPFVFYTATYTTPSDEQLALSAGADLFLVKPLEPEVFVSRIADVLERCDRGSLRAEPLPALDDVRYLKEYSEALVRKLEDKLAQVEEANRALLVKSFAIESAPSGILLTTLDGSVTYSNPAAAAMLTTSSDALAGARLDDLFGGCSAWQAAADQLRHSGHWSGELRLADAGRADRTLAAAVHTVKSEDGAAICRMVSVEDVTDRKRAADDVQRSERLVSLSLFAAGVAHDFNNLLTGVFGNVELALARLAPEHPARPQLEQVAVAFERARNLTHRLITFAKGSPPVRRQLRIVDLIQECCSLALAGSGVDCRLACDPGLWSLEGDANQLSQVFTNVLLNARQAMNDRGVVHVTVENLEQRGTREGLPTQRFVAVTIADEGPGIPDEALPHLFTPLFTTKPGGSGLGLATSYCIVEAHQGRMDVTSGPGRGAAFRVLLPASESAGVPAGRQQPGSAGPAPGREGARILVMDDEQPVRELAGRMLERNGYRVTTAAHGEEVLELCAAAQQERRPFDAVLLDVTVPGRMGGHETLCRLNRRHPGLPVILSSGYDQEALSGEGIRPAAVLPKPYSMHELVSCVAAVVARRGERLG